jgi:hypothetical protein
MELEVNRGGPVKFRRNHKMIGLHAVETEGFGVVIKRTKDDEMTSTQTQETQVEET